jgi:uncharacterized membrane protein YkvA (DUF1232 family)
MKFFRLGTMLMNYWRMARDPRSPRIVRLLLYAGLAYALIPIDLIPIWIPVLGLLDDAAILSGVVAIGMTMMPPEVKAN